MTVFLYLRCIQFAEHVIGMQNELAILEFIHCLVETLDRYAEIFGAASSILCML